MIGQVGLLYQIDDGLECLRIIHREVGESFAVERNVLLCQIAHQDRVGHSVLAGTRVDTGDPQAAEVSLFSLSVAVGVLLAFLPRVHRYGPDVFAFSEITAGAF